MYYVLLFFFNDRATTEIYPASHTLSLHGALPIWADTVGQPICGAAHQYTATTTTTASTSFSATPTSLYAAYSASGTSSSANQLTRPGPCRRRAAPAPD